MRRIWWARPSPGTLDAQGEIKARSCAGSLDALARDLSPVEAGERGRGDLVGALLNLLLTSGEDDLDVAGVAEVGVDATVCAVSAAAGFLSARLGKAGK